MPEPLSRPSRSGSVLDDASVDGAGVAIATIADVSAPQGDAIIYWNGEMRAAFAGATHGDYDYPKRLNDYVPQYGLVRYPAPAQALTPGRVRIHCEQAGIGPSGVGLPAEAVLSGGWARSERGRQGAAGHDHE